MASLPLYGGTVNASVQLPGTSLPPMTTYIQNASSLLYSFSSIYSTFNCHLMFLWWLSHFRFPIALATFSSLHVISFTALARHCRFSHLHIHLFFKVFSPPLNSLFLQLYSVVTFISSCPVFLLSFCTHFRYRHFIALIHLTQPLSSYPPHTHTHVVSPGNVSDSRTSSGHRQRRLLEATER